MKELGKTIILVVLAMCMSYSFFLVTWTYTAVEQYKSEFHLTGQASGIVSLCINEPPTINISNCSPNATQGVFYDCWITGEDATQPSVTFGSTFINISRDFSNSTEPLFDATPAGYISFLPNNTDVGNYRINLYVDDLLGCSNSVNNTLFLLEVLNINDPPYLIEEIPDVEYKENEAIHPFFLTNYFADPDRDPLTFNVSGNDKIEITISSNGDVVVSSETCNLIEYVLFTAIDPYGATATSNLVEIKCMENPDDSEGSSGYGSGGGGGGGTSRICIPEYECFDYHMCNRSNVKIQRCIDIKGCEEERLIKVPCLYEEKKSCNESWMCSDWERCLPNGTQYRNCTDKNSCGLKEFMPALQQACEYIGTCDDGLQNCHDGSCEEGIDCGGPCDTCKSVQVPYAFEEKQGIWMYLFTGILLLILTASLLYHYFHKEINAALAKLGWLISGRRKKQILLKLEEKRNLLSAIADIEKKLKKEELMELLNDYGRAIRFLLMSVCRGALQEEFDDSQLSAAMKNRRIIRPVLRKIFSSMSSRYDSVIRNNTLISEASIRLLIEELRNIVLHISEAEPGDRTRNEQELTAPESWNIADKMSIKIANIYIVLQFTELEVAKKKYLELISEYAKLSIEEQAAVFGNVSRLYDNIDYVNSWAKN